MLDTDTTTRPFPSSCYTLLLSDLPHSSPFHGLPPSSVLSATLEYPFPSDLHAHPTILQWAEYRDDVQQLVASSKSQRVQGEGE
jgi:hypothetical protein